ncbi:MFS transporter [Lachnoclostridium sp. An181]|uniref:MFS transporter n=1 Tax=Lachnoclostridium sp. An181 TaxID=1965575 RepID=UPI000B365E41|nr:MFS transporter [Lachnoclostridium sp. An181]OUP48783.1 MFS transporter [Lachnoclostridium sp. An181]
MKEKTIPKLFTRNFTFLILGQVSSLLGNYTLKFALSMYVLEQTGSASVFAGLLALALLPTIFLSPFGGILADRANRRNIMVTLDTLSGLSVLIAGFAMFFGGNILVIGVLLIILSVLGAFESPTVQACIPQMLSGDNILKGNAIVNQVASIATLITPFLGSMFYTAFGIQPVFYASVACFFVTALLECFIRLDYKKPDRKMGIRAIVKEDFSVSINFLRLEQPDILKLLLLAALVSLFVAGTAVVGFPYLVRTVLGLSAGHYGIAESLMGVASILGSLCVAMFAKNLRLRHLSIVLISFGFCLIPCGIAFLLPVDDFTCYLILLLMFCACQLGCSFFSTYAISIIQERTPQHLMGKVMSCVFTFSMCAQPVGQIVYGALFDRFSDSAYWILIPSGLIVCAIGMASTGFFAKFGKPTIKDQTVSLGNP